MLPHWAKFLVRYYDCWGFRTGWNTSSGYKKFIRSILILHIILVTIVTIHIVHYLTRLIINDTLATVNDAAKFSGALIVYWSTIIESNLECKSKDRFWKIYRIIDERYCKHRTTKRHWPYLIKLFIYFLGVTLSYLLVLRNVIQFAGTKYVHFWLSYVLLMFVHQHRQFYSLFFLNLIENELKEIEKETNRMFNSFKSNKGVEPMSRNYEIIRLKWIREYYKLVHQMCECMNESVLGWSNVPVVLFSFGILLTDLNWMYWKWYNKQRILIFGELQKNCLA